METQQLNIKAEIETVTFQSEESGWTVLKARNCASNATFTATGSFSTIHPGESFEFFGIWRKHPSFGRQFVVNRATALRPSTRAAITRYLASGLFKGIGEKTAQKIVAIFGTETLNIFDKDIKRLSEVPTLGEKKVEQIIISWEEQRAAADIMMFLNQHGISNSFAHRILRLYGSNSIELISSDPYRLAVDIRGIGFVSADKIAQSMGIEENSPQRIRAAVLYQLQQAEDNGHCYLTHIQLVNNLSETLKLKTTEFSSILPECLQQLSGMNVLVSESFELEDGTQTQAHYRSDTFIAELNISSAAKGILLTKPENDDSNSAGFKLRLENWIDKYCKTSNLKLSAKQSIAIKEAASHKIFILTGGPGVGKTTTANTIIRLLKAMGKTVTLAAPTGRAAQRLSEVSSSEAKTIHRLLEWSPSEHCFLRDENNPLGSDIIIVDESSMLDVRLADSLFRAIRKKSRLILIGDVDQLPSVGPGNVLKDLIDSKVVPCVELDEIFRQANSSKIISTAHAINHGINPEFNNDFESDCRFITAKSSDEIKDVVKDLLAVQLPKAGYDPFTDIQVLTPMNRGELGTNQINENLQELLNPNSNSSKEYKRKNFVIREKDKVIQSVNNYDLAVFNGDIGYVEHSNVDGAKLIVNFNGRLVSYDSEQALDLRLAYSITIHKSQGSEFPVVIIPISMQHYIMLQRNLIYTGLTRAKKLAIFVGSTKALSYAAQNQVSHTRQTQLKSRLVRSLS